MTTAGSPTGLDALLRPSWGSRATRGLGGDSEAYRATESLAAESPDNQTYNRKN